MPNPIECFLLVGIPAAGKTTYAKKLSTITGSVVLSTDKIREKLYGSENIQGNWLEIEKELHKLIKHYTRLGIKVIVDATHTKPEHRKPLLKLSSHIKWSCYWLDADLKECLERNNQRSRIVPTSIIKTMHKQLKLTPPTKAEGFENIYQMEV